jgi:hypothetical protein
LWRTDGRPARTAISSERGRRGRGKVRQGVDDSPQIHEANHLGKGKGGDPHTGGNMQERRERLREGSVEQDRREEDQSKMTGRYAGQMRRKQGDHEWKTRCGKATKHAARCDKDVAMDLAIACLLCSKSILIGDEERRRAVVGIVTSLSQKRASMLRSRGIRSTE